MIERRKHRRIVTLRNFGWLLVVVLVVFIGLSFDLTAHRAPRTGYGRILDREIEKKEELHPQPQIVTEAKPVPDQTGADPLLLAPAAREQEFLTTEPVRPVAASTMEARGSGVNIVGDSGGVTIVRNGDAAVKRPVLSGGIFKQP